MFLFGIACRAQSGKCYSLGQSSSKKNEISISGENKEAKKKTQKSQGLFVFLMALLRDAPMGGNAGSCRERRLWRREQRVSSV